MGVVMLGVDLVTAGEGGEAVRIAEVLVEDAVNEVADKELLELSEKEAVEEAGETTCQIYIKTNEATGEVYSGCTSGKGTPSENVAARDKNHHMNDKVYRPAKLDVSSTKKKAIRGRE